ncbi:endonuclease 8-like 1 [Procambarus clarkii]|uniref:endonuclease 8-like 1 n=1 Tax=Procambarus clarkii TaxID=6728 RepID=UPI003743F942
MPEGPELFLASIFINTVSQERLYGGRVVKSEVSTRNPEVAWEAAEYNLHAVARGKELKVTLCERARDQKGGKALDIVFRFGMSGSFKFTPVDDMPKHAHLRFYTINEEIPMVLSFVDYRRFGRWEVGGTWGRDRGPDPVWEYESFRENIMANLDSSVFKKPICEAMLDQKYFNGIGNYLRAEILYRGNIRPFDEAREVLSELKPFSKWNTVQTKQEKDDMCEVKPDFLDLCCILPKEVIHLSGGGKGYNVDPDADDNEYKEFRAWLQCYYQDGMRNLVDHNGRTMWFSGEPGRLAPKDVSSRGKVKRKMIKKNEQQESGVEVPNTIAEKKGRRKAKQAKHEAGEETMQVNINKASRKQPKEAAKEDSCTEPTLSSRLRNKWSKLQESTTATNIVKKKLSEKSK